MTDNRAVNGGGGSAGQTVAVGLGDRAGVWLDSVGQPGEKVIELLAHDGRITTIVQRPDGQLVVRTDGLRDVAHAVCVAADGTAEPVPHRML